MSTEISYRSTEWLSLTQIKKLLDTGELEIPSTNGVVVLYVNYNDRVAAHAFGKNKK